MVPEALDTSGLAAALSNPLAQSVEIAPENRELIAYGEHSRGIIRIEELAPRSKVAANYASNGLHRPVFRSLATRLRFFMVHFREWMTARFFLEQLLNGWQGDITDLWIDDDYGEIWKGQDFLDRLLADQAWDWRRKRIWHLVIASKDSITFAEIAGWVAARYSERSEADADCEEIRVSDLPLKPEADGPAVALFPLKTVPTALDDPLLIEMLGETFGQSILGYSCWILRYRTHELAKQVLQTCLEGLGERSQHVLVDFDGTSLTGGESHEWISLEPDWDWRNAS